MPSEFKINSPSVLRRNADGTYDRIHYEASIDLDLLRALAVKASRSKGQTAKDGPLTVRVTSVEVQARWRAIP